MYSDAVGVRSSIYTGNDVVLIWALIAPAVFVP